MVICVTPGTLPKLVGNSREWSWVCGFDPVMRTLYWVQCSMEICSLVSLFVEDLREERFGYLHLVL